MGNINWVAKACGVLMLWATAAIVLPAQKITTLHSFDYGDGAFPEAGLVQGTDGKLYGTTKNGGGANVVCNGSEGCGTVFKITLGGTLTTLYSFCLQGGFCVDGSLPYAGLVQGTDGNFYGTTSNGGASGNQVDCPEGCGTVFKITSSGVLTTLHSFCSQSNCPDGYFPDAGLVQGNNGILYGTTYVGGIHGAGTVFKITSSGVLTTLHSFDNADGAAPNAGLVPGADGNFYGTTTGGGTNLEGTVFKITPSNVLTTIYSFCSQRNCTDGSKPFAGLVPGSDGNFYGTTSMGGVNNSCPNGCGTVFKITPSGMLTTLHSFDGTDGETPYAGLVQATDGNFYGTTWGGNNDPGTVFRITASGTLMTRSFAGGDGAFAFAGLAQDTNGTLYGTTQSGGVNGFGNVFSVSVGLGPFVETQPTSRMVGAAVKILGTNLIGATRVTFNGTPATFTVISKSLITTTVPAGATTGTVQVVTPGGTLSSNVPFRVKS